MEEVYSLVKEANKYFETADHLAYVTYPLIKETKLIITIAENLYNAMTKAMNAVLRYERMYKRIPVQGESFVTKIDTFKKCAERYQIPREHVQLMVDLRNLLADRKESPIEFSRGEKFVICSENYRTTTLSYNKVKTYITQGKDFIDKVNRIFKNDRGLSRYSKRSIA